MYYNRTKNKQIKQKEIKNNNDKLYINNREIKQVHNINFLGIVIDDK